MKIETVNDNTGSQRTYLPYRFSDVCPVCGKEESIDISNEFGYLSYPRFDKPIKIRFQHFDETGSVITECKGWQAEIKIDITITEVSNPRGVK